MTEQDYPLARDPAGPWDVEIRSCTKTESGHDMFTFRCNWRKLPTLRDCDIYIVHSKP